MITNHKKSKKWKEYSKIFNSPSKYEKVFLIKKTKNKNSLIDKKTKKDETRVGKRKIEKQWTKQLGTSSTDTGYGVTTDSSGNIYVTGGTTGGLDGNTRLGSGDIFLVKYDSSGTKQ